MPYEYTTWQKYTLKLKPTKETAEKWLIIAYYFYFDGNIWEETHFLTLTMRHPTERILSWESRILTHSRRVVRYSILISFYLRHPCKEYQAWLSASYKGCIRKCQSQDPFLCRVYICKSAKQEGRGGECSPPLFNNLW